MFSLDSDKAPGPDGFGAHFFKTAWSFVGEQVCIKSFFVIVKILGEANATITLILKVKTPSWTSKFRPISFCKTLYKCISKILERLKVCLSSSQTAFILGRKISDNVLLAQELIREGWSAA